MRTAPLTILKITAHLLGTMCERNPRLIENKNWQAAAQGTAGLIKEIESFICLSDVIVPVDFSAEVEIEPIEDPRQLRFGAVL